MRNVNKPDECNVATRGEKNELT